MDNSVEFLKSHNSYARRNVSEDEEEDVLTAKVILIGDSSVGKTSILFRYMQDGFLDNPNVTLGLELSIKRVQLENNESIVLNIWDSAGQEKYRSLTYHFYKGVNGIILVFDVMNPESVKSLNSWMAQINKHAPENVDIILVGNKSDDIGEEESLGQKNKETSDMIRKLGMSYLETSAKTGKNINKVFYSIAKMIKSRHALEHVVRKDTNHNSARRPKIKRDNRKEDAVILKLERKESNGAKKNSNCCL